MRSLKQHLLAFTALLPFLFSSVADAQLRRAITADSLSGVEMFIDGPESVVRGESARWLLQVFEVSGLNELRPAAGARVSFASSLSERATEFEADSLGRVTIEVPIPQDAEASARATITARVLRGASRRFSLPFATSDPSSLTIHAPAAAVEGSRIPMTFRRAGFNHAESELKVEFSDERGPLGSPERVRTDADGLAELAFRAPRDSRQLTIVVSTRRRDPAAGQSVWEQAASAQVAIRRRPARASSNQLVVQARAIEDVITLGSSARAEVYVRRADGRPVEGALVSTNAVVLRRALIGERSMEDAVSARTDARGRAVLTIAEESLSRGLQFRHGFVDHSVAITAGAVGLGTAQASATFRITNQNHFVTFAVEGGALTPGVPSRVHVLAVDRRGVPATDVTVALSGAAFQRQEAATGADGIATFELVVGDTSGEEDCGGAQATEVRVGLAQNDGSAFCTRVDNLQSVRPRLELVRDAADQVTVQASVRRRAFASQRAVELVLFEARGSNVSEVLIETRVLSANEDSATFEVPEGSLPNLMIRARALGDLGRSMRGGFARLSMRPEARSLQVSGSDTGITVSEGSGDWTGWRTVVTAVPSPSGVRQVARPISDWLAAVSIYRGDDGASYVYREGELISMPLPDDGGPLRDPWRASERFIQGRLGLLFRALESHVEANMPGNEELVAVRGPRGWEFKDSVLSALPAGELGAEGAAGLGGRPLTIDDVRESDRSFDFDAVASRVTRRRLFMLLLALREFVRERQFDLPWATPGDPNEWLASLQGRSTPNGDIIEGRGLADAWGNRFELRRVTGRAERTVMPVSGYELVSAGPDGRFGTRDDMRDPTAPVLRDGLYAEAVAEDLLVARLSGVELGRATTTSLSEIFGAAVGTIEHVHNGGGRISDAPPIPGVMPDLTFATHVQRSLIPATGVSGILDSGSGTFSVDEEPRVWAVTTTSFGPHGETFNATNFVQAGPPLFLVEELPDRLRVDEPFEAYVDIVNLSDEPVSFEVRSLERGVETAPASVRVGVGEMGRAPLRFVAQQSGRSAIALDVRSEEHARRVLRGVTVIRGLHPIRRAAMGVGPFRSTLEVPSGAQGAQTRLVVVRGDRLDLDPDLAAMRDDIPGTLAWARAFRGEQVTHELRSALIRESISPFDVAPAVLALSGMFQEDGSPDAVAARRAAELRNMLTGSLTGRLGDPDPQAGAIRLAASALTSLASVGGESGLPVESWKVTLRRTLREYPSEPTLLARAAAALLVADARDGHARVMYELAIDAVSDGMVRGSDSRPGRIERTSATLALAIAAHQLGDTSRARSLLRAAAREGLAFTVQPSESTFWWIAAGSYGVLASAAESSAIVSAGGTDRSLSLEDGATSLPLEVSAGDSVTVSSDSPALFRLESVFGRAFTNESGPLLLEVRGQAGTLGEPSAIELGVTAASEVTAPVIEVQLPAGPALSPEDLTRFTSHAAVQSAEMRSSGILRVLLAPMREGQQVFVPLPHFWISPSAVTGFAVVGYSAPDPSRMSSLAGRQLSPSPVSSLAERAN